MVSVVDRLLPRMRLSPPPERLAREEAQARLFIAERVARARWLLGSLAARRRTLTRLMRLILEEQSGFFRLGVDALRPLGYRRMAELMGLHESTIARAVRGKYVETPRGLFPLRFFFDHGLSTRDGAPRASAAIAHRVRSLVSAEAPGDPLSDEEIARRLHGDGVRIARRTVAKYRERMSIPKAAYRRRT
jgi:RNA polymerase sigma-54 factor